MLALYPLKPYYTPVMYGFIGSYPSLNILKAAAIIFCFLVFFSFLPVSFCDASALPPALNSEGSIDAMDFFLGSLFLQSGGVHLFLCPALFHSGALSTDKVAVSDALIGKNLQEIFKPAFLFTSLSPTVFPRSFLF